MAAAGPTLGTRRHIKQETESTPGPQYDLIQTTNVVRKQAPTIGFPKSSRSGLPTDAQRHGPGPAGFSISLKHTKQRVPSAKISARTTFGSFVRNDKHSAAEPGPGSYQIGAGKEDPGRPRSPRAAFSKSPRGEARSDRGQRDRSPGPGRYNVQKSSKTSSRVRRAPAVTLSPRLLHPGPQPEGRSAQFIGPGKGFGEARGRQARSGWRSTQGGSMGKSPRGPGAAEERKRAESPGPGYYTQGTNHLTRAPAYSLQARRPLTGAASNEGSGSQVGPGSYDLVGSGKASGAVSDAVRPRSPRIGFGRAGRRPLQDTGRVGPGPGAYMVPSSLVLGSKHTVLTRGPGGISQRGKPGNEASPKRGRARAQIGASAPGPGHYELRDPAGYIAGASTSKRASSPRGGSFARSGRGEDRKSPRGAKGARGRSRSPRGGASGDGPGPASYLPGDMHRKRAPAISMSFRPPQGPTKDAGDPTLCRVDGAVGKQTVVSSQRASPRWGFSKAPRFGAVSGS